MKVMSYTDLRKNLAMTLEEVIESHEPVLITRKNHQTAVLISLDDFNAYEETAYLMKNPKNAQRLIDSIAQIEAGQAVERELIEE